MSCGAAWALQSWQSLHRQLAIVGQSSPRDEQDCKGAGKLHIWFYMRMCKIWRVWKTCAAVSVHGFEAWGRLPLFLSTGQGSAGYIRLFYSDIWKLLLLDFVLRLFHQTDLELSFSTELCFTVVSAVLIITSVGWLRTIWQMHLRNNCVSKVTKKCSGVEEMHIG